MCYQLILGLQCGVSHEPLFSSLKQAFLIFRTQRDSIKTELTVADWQVSGPFFDTVLDVLLIWVGTGQIFTFLQVLMFSDIN